MLEFPLDKIECAMFKGIEQEGPLKGKLTLFVVGDIPATKIYKALHYHNIRNVYFGAGGRFEFNEETVYDLATNGAGIYPIDNITIESPDFDFVLFKKLRFHKNAKWVIPYIWNGKILSSGMLNVERIAGMAYANKAHVYAKVDICNRVFLSPISDTFVNQYALGYHEDTLLMQVER